MEYKLFLQEKATSADYLKAMFNSQVYDVALVSPLQTMEKLSQRIGNDILIKREDRQPVYSFKLRGAYAMVASLSKAQQAMGVIAASAGNHAQGVALSAQKLGLKALIVMPENTPTIKVEAVKNYGADVFLYGENFDEAKNKAIVLAQEKQMTFIPPFDHPIVIAGQGSIGLELLQQNARLDRIFIPVGGGGLIAGIATCIKQLLPEIKIIGVEPKDSASLYYALKAGHPVELERVGLFADGVAVKKIGEETFRLCQQYVDDVVLVEEDEICAAMKDIFEDVRAIAEPSGAVSLAGLKKYVEQHHIQGENLVNILSGANINFHTLRYVSERCEIGENQEALFAVTMPEEKGHFLHFCRLLDHRAVTEFNYRYGDEKRACVFVGIRIKGKHERQEIIQQLQAHDYLVQDLSDDEVAKTHIRYMIGGRPTTPYQEKLYQFDFPDQKGALLKFLETLGIHWNISLFHYRALGADYSHVLAGFQFTEDNHLAFKQHLQKLGYAYQDVSHSLSYQYFLK